MTSHQRYLINSKMASDMDKSDMQGDIWYASRIVDLPGMGGC